MDKKIDNFYETTIFFSQVNSFFFARSRAKTTMLYNLFQVMTMLATIVVNIITLI